VSEMTEEGDRQRGTVGKEWMGERDVYIYIYIYINVKKNTNEWKLAQR
jgi:hypothetical protein